MTRDEWISTGKANRIFDGGIDDRTFRDKFRDALRTKLTPGGQFRWLRTEVEQLAHAPEAKAG